MRVIAMAVLMAVGSVLLLLGPWVACRLPGRGFDPVAVGRGLQVVGAILLLTAVLIRPENPETSAFPPPTAHGER